jgi:hypothetical protein
MQFRDSKCFSSIDCYFCLSCDFQCLVNLPAAASPQPERLDHSFHYSSLLPSSTPLCMLLSTISHVCDNCYFLVERSYPHSDSQIREADMTSITALALLPAAPSARRFPITPPYPEPDFDCPSFMAQSIPAEINPITTAALPTTPISISSASNLTSVQDATLGPKSGSPSKSDSNLSSIATAGLQTSPGPSAKPGKLSQSAPFQMTAAEAVDDLRKQREEESRKTSPNPARNALSSLMGVQDVGMSTPKDAPTATNTLSEPLAAVSKSIKVSEPAQGDSQQQTSPVSMSSFGTGESTAAPTAMVTTPPVASPGSIDERSPRDDGTRTKRKASAEPSPEDSHKAFSYPGPLLGVQSNDPRRGMSLPHSGLRQGSPRSPSTKKHKCPYCSTEFTRHHNLKSHLLTHSQEKPYVCQTCQSRFRRLHDLKRHTKLHTGERPHICPKCGRRFARGDALARHNKGQGGCAGRRSSMGSYGGDDDYPEGAGPDDSMDGLMYTNEPERIEDDEDEDHRRQSLPSIKKHSAADSDARSAAPASSGFPARQPSTYPPIAAGRQPAGGLFPPNASHGGSSTSTSPGSATGTMSFPPGTATSAFHPSGSGPVFPQAAMTESPKPLSPRSGAARQLGHDAVLHRNRSPSLTQQMQQQRYGRRSPPPVGLSHPTLTAPQLPIPPGGLNPPESRYTISNQPTHPPTNPSGPPAHMSTGGASSHSNSLSSHGPSSHGGQGSGDLPSSSSAFGPNPEALWNYIRKLESKFDRLQEEVVSLKAQLAAATSQQQNR